MVEMVLDVSSNARAPGIAREALRDMLDESIPRAFSLDAQLAITELVTNSVRHVRAPSTIEVRADLSTERLRVEIRDRGAGFTYLDTAPAAEAEGGWGLLIVDRVADRWGFSEKPGTAWFELDR